MEDLPTLHGPKNKTMGLEVISPSAQMWINTNSKTGQEEKRAHNLFKDVAVAGLQAFHHKLQHETKQPKSEQRLRASAFPLLRHKQSKQPRFQSSSLVLKLCLQAKKCRGTKLCGVWPTQISFNLQQTES